ncbi:imelysin family protein [Parasulfitobacter algicola]|uniref:Imelysin family protein n=1 Tax=Parasulfitobacter algicola TaxID=2614809 RepID=A0ABX2IST7_9RHOB|nr:imelysin family protein [Sulfitobacter algicola]NSX55977.1 imelysin family protein [Sulfitobacter algicola]
MKRFLLTAVLAATPITANAQTATIDDIVNAHILPRFQTLAETSAHLATTARNDCSITSQTLQAAYSDAFDAWVSASHLRFGPTEVDDRAFALAFWPDSRGATPRTLAKLLTDQDPVIASAEDYAQVSIAARGFYAMEFLLYDEALSNIGDADDHCTLIQTVTTDIATTSAAILDDWKTDYAARLSSPDASGTYRSEEEVLQELFKTLATGLQFTSETRLGRPLGTFDRPHPTRAEGWRSGRSARHVGLSLAALNDLALRLSNDDLDISERIETSFERSIALLAELNDPIFTGVAAPQSRLKVEVLRQSIDSIRALVRDELGPTLGVAAGFNSLDGD